MKRLASAIIAVMILGFGSALFAQESSIDFKVGAGFPKAPDKTGLDTALDLNLGLDKYFNLGLETGFGWIKWEDKDFTNKVGNLSLTQVKTANLYSLPLLAVASIRFADVESSYGVLPYISGGAGYSWTWYRHPEVNDTFRGFTWQAFAGLAFKPGEGSIMKIIIEGGYRGADIKNSDSFKLDMSGAFVRAGLSFPISSAE